MPAIGSFSDIGVELDSNNHVAVIEIQRPPHNFFDFNLIAQIADALDALDAEDGCRAIVLAAQGKSFCAGANFGAAGNDVKNAVGSGDGGFENSAGQLYREATRLFRNQKPIVGAIQGAAIGGGLGLAMMPDFRVCAPEARFSANFSLLGFHQGFGLSFTLPRIVGQQRANLLLYTGRRIKGEEAAAWGLADQCVPLDQLRSAAIGLAAEIATAGPLAVRAIRATMRAGFAEGVKAATDRELGEQARLMDTQDFREGIKATAERRTPNFVGA